MSVGMRTTLGLILLVLSTHANAALIEFDLTRGQGGSNLQTHEHTFMSAGYGLNVYGYTQVGPSTLAEADIMRGLTGLGVSTDDSDPSDTSHLDSVGRTELLMFEIPVGTIAHSISIWNFQSGEMLSIFGNDCRIRICNPTIIAGSSQSVEGSSISNPDEMVFNSAQGIDFVAVLANGVGNQSDLDSVVRISSFTLSVPDVNVPEPSTMLLMVMGLVLVVIKQSRIRR